MHSAADIGVLATCTVAWNPAIRDPSLIGPLVRSLRLLRLHDPHAHLIIRHATQAVRTGQRVTKARANVCRRNAL
jgi:hypothetical protein